MAECAVIKVNGAIKGCKIILNPDFLGNWWKRYFPDIKEDDGESCSAVEICGSVSSIKHSRELWVGEGEAHYFLFPEQQHNNSQVEAAKKELIQRSLLLGSPYPPGFTVVQVTG